MDKKVFNFEIYTCHPQTGQTGWDIQFITVFADSKDQAKEILKTTPLFDCIILSNIVGGKMDEDDMDWWVTGHDYVYTDNNYNNVSAKAFVR